MKNRSNRPFECVFVLFEFYASEQIKRTRCKNDAHFWAHFIVQLMRGCPLNKPTFDTENKGTKKNVGAVFYRTQNNIAYRLVRLLTSNNLCSVHKPHFGIILSRFWWNFECFSLLINFNFCYQNESAEPNWNQPWKQRQKWKEDNSKFNSSYCAHIKATAVSFWHFAANGTKKSFRFSCVEFDKHSYFSSHHLRIGIRWPREAK